MKSLRLSNCFCGARLQAEMRQEKTTTVISPGIELEVWNRRMPEVCIFELHFSMSYFQPFPLFSRRTFGSGARAPTRSTTPCTPWASSASRLLLLRLPPPSRGAMTPETPSARSQGTSSHGSTSSSRRCWGPSRTRGWSRYECKFEFYGIVLIVKFALF